jgi:hypothetical protein
MSDDILKQMEALKIKIDSHKALRGQVDAEVKWTMQKLKEDFDCNSIEEAQGLLIQMIDEANETKSQLTAQYAELLREAQDKGLV